MLLIAVYIETEHPRWGLIQSVVPTKALSAHTELFTYYGYGDEGGLFPEDFPWYFELKKNLQDKMKMK